MTTLKRITVGSWYALLTVGFMVPTSIAQQDREQKDVVRPLKFEPDLKDPVIERQIRELRGMGKLLILTSADEVGNLVGKDLAKVLVDTVDFTKEKIVLVSWRSAGPPFATLKHEVVGTGKDRKVNFFMEGPPTGLEALRTGAEFFAVAKDRAVSFENERRAPQKDKNILRPLNFGLDRKELILRGLLGQNKLLIMADAEAVEKLFGKDAAKELAGAVDFTKEKIAFVSWSSNGPPFPKFKHEVVGVGKDRRLVFFLEGPPSNKDARTGGTHFYAVPRDLAVSFELGRREPVPEKNP